MITEIYKEKQNDKAKRKNQKTQKAIRDWRQHKINVLKLHNIGHIEKYSYKLEFAIITNILYNNGTYSQECGKLVKLDGMYAFKSSIDYFGTSKEYPYKLRFYLPDNINILVQNKYGYYFDWNFEKVNKILDLELIGILLDNLRAGKRRELIRLIKSLLLLKFKGLEYDMLINFVDEFFYKNGLNTLQN